METSGRILMITTVLLHGRRSVTTLVALCALAAAAPARAQLGLALVPMKAEIKAAPGQQYSGSLKLSSGSGDKTRIRAEVLDFNIDDKQTPQFERNLPPEAPYSCKTWLSLNPVEAEIQKEGFLMVRYTFRLPADVAEGSYNCAAGFTTLPSAEQAAEGIGMRMAVRIVCAFYIQVGSPAVQGTLKEIKLEALPPAKDSKTPDWQAVVVLENRGLMYFRPVGKLEVLDAEGKVVESHEFQSLPVLRQREQRFLFPLENPLQAGKHQLRARIDIGTGEILQSTADIETEAESPAAAPQSSGK